MSLLLKMNDQMWDSIYSLQASTSQHRPNESRVNYGTSDGSIGGSLLEALGHALQYASLYENNAQLTRLCCEKI